jgi:P-type Ca2+ transporter type 2C
MAIVGVSLAVAAVPESLPAVVAIALALGAHRMAKRSAVVRRLPAVETLGSVTVIATDKTGTITEGRMVVERLWTPNSEYAVAGHGYDPSGSIRPDQTDGSAQVDRDAARDRLLRDVALCNDARLVRGTQWSVIGDPLEGALLVVATKGGHDVVSLHNAWTRTAEQPFDPLTRRMTTTHRHTDGRELVVCKGAPEAVLSALETSHDVGRATLVAEELAAEGYRVIAVADHETTDPNTSADKIVLTLAGLVAIDDPPREHADKVVAACHRAGVRLLLVTGDHPGTARAIARRVGILDAGRAKSHGPSVYARVRPEEKVAIVQSLQHQGEVVAMIGDGVNDAPALRCADIGVAAGLGGTEVARQAADLVLMDDNLSTVVSAVEEGRRIYANIRAFLLYAVSGGLAEVATMLVGPLLGIAQPLLPGQILWINLLTHGLAGVAFGAEPADPAEMARPPRPPEQSVFTPRFTIHLCVAAVTLMAASLTVGVLGTSGAEQRTSIFLTLGLGQLAVAWAIRSRPQTRTRGRSLPLAIAGAAALMLLGALAPPMQALLETRPLEAVTLLTVAMAAAVPGLVVGTLVRQERRRFLAGSTT